MKENIIRVILFLQSKQNDFFYYFCIFLVYIFFSQGLSQGNHYSGYPYYSLLVKAFLEGRLNVISLNYYDLSFFQGKWYLYWGPTPVIFIIPFYLIGMKDILYTLIAGLGNIILFSTLVTQFVSYFHLKTSTLQKKIVILAFAFSPNFYMSLFGRVWHTEQIISMLFLLFFLNFYFVFLRKKSNKYIFLSVIFFYLAVFSRYSLLIYSLLFLYSAWVFVKNKKKLFTLCTAFFCLGIISVAVFFLYNYARFGSITNYGLFFQ